MFNRYKDRGFPEKFQARCKCIGLFQRIHGVDTLLYAMYVYEYGQDCEAPNRRRVYISYLDSVKYFEPQHFRTIAYQSILVEYLRYVKRRGFHTAHIWSCPPTPGDDYIFYCHPKGQLTPRDDMLRAWYHAMLHKAKGEGIVLRTTTLYDDYFTSENIDSLACKATTQLPYFEGDYIPGEIENVLQSRGESDSENDFVLEHLRKNLLKMKDNFIVAHLRNRKFAAAVERGEDVSRWHEDSDEEAIRSKRARITSKDSSILREKRKQSNAVASDISNSLPEGERAMPPGTFADAATEESGIEDRDAQVAEPLSGKNEAAESDAPKVSETKALDTAIDVETAASSPSPSVELGEKNPKDTVSGKGSFVEAVPGGEQQGAPDAADMEDQAKATLLAANRAATKISETTTSPDARSSDSKTENKPKDPTVSDIPADIAAKSLGATATPRDVTEESVSRDDNTHAECKAVVSDQDGVCKDQQAPAKEFQYPEEPVTDSASKKRSLAEIQPYAEMHEESLSNGEAFVPDTSDEDSPRKAELFESRQRFLNYCQITHCQFDELRRSKHSTMLILFQLHNPSAPLFLKQCGACYRDITHGIRFHCNDCSNFDLCQECYEPVMSGIWAKRDKRFEHSKDHTFTPIDMEVNRERDKRLRQKQQQMDDRRRKSQNTLYHTN